MKSVALTAALVVLAATGAAQSAPTPSAGRAPLPLKRAPTPTTAAITSTDLMSRIYAYADDSMLGRAAGTESNLKATAMIAAELKRLGLQPAGDNGTYFQEVMLVQRVADEKAVLTLGATPLKKGEGYLARDQGGPMRSIDDALKDILDDWERKTKNG